MLYGEVPDVKLGHTRYNLDNNNTTTTTTNTNTKTTPLTQPSPQSSPPPLPPLPPQTKPTHPETSQTGLLCRGFMPPSLCFPQNSAFAPGSEKVASFWQLEACAHTTAAHIFILQKRKKTLAVRSRISSQLIFESCVGYFDRAYYGFHVTSSLSLIHI